METYPVDKLRPRSRPVDDREPPASSANHRVIGRRDQLAVWRKPDVTDEAAVLYSGRPTGNSSCSSAANAAYDRQATTVRRHSASRHVFRQDPRRRTEDRRSSQRTFAHPPVIRVSE